MEINCGVTCYISGTSLQLVLVMLFLWHFFIQLEIASA